MRHIPRSYERSSSADRLSQPTYIRRRIDVSVALASTRTNEKMPFSRAKTVAARAGLAGVGGVDKNGTDANFLGLIGDKVLQLSPRPSVQPTPHPPARLDAVTDVGQVFHGNGANFKALRLLHKFPAADMVVVPSLPGLSPFDLANRLFRALRAFAFEPLAMRPGHVPSMFHSICRPNHAGAGGSHGQLADVDAKHILAGGLGGVGAAHDDVQVPFAAFADQTRLLRRAQARHAALLLAEDAGHDDASMRGKQGKPAFEDAVGPGIESAGAVRAVVQRWPGLVAVKAAKLAERLIGASYLFDGQNSNLGRHVDRITQVVVAQAMQVKTVFDFSALRQKAKDVAGIGEQPLCGNKRLNLPRMGHQFHTNNALHGTTYTENRPMVRNIRQKPTGLAARALYLLVLKDQVSRAF
jgi:hypothetical protein